MRNRLVRSFNGVIFDVSVIMLDADQNRAWAGAFIPAHACKHLKIVGPARFFLVYQCVLGHEH
jgi:hypothetical protein